jgi:hypothetical protein
VSTNPSANVVVHLFKAAAPGPLARCSIRGQALPGRAGWRPAPGSRPRNSRPDHHRGAADQREGVLAGRAVLRDGRIGATLQYVRSLSASRLTSTRAITPRQGGSLEFGRRLGGECPLDTARSGFARSDGIPKWPHTSERAAAAAQFGPVGHGLTRPVGRCCGCHRSTVPSPLRRRPSRFAGVFTRPQPGPAVRAAGRTHSRTVGCSASGSRVRSSFVPVSAPRARVTRSACRMVRGRARDGNGDGDDVTVYFAADSGRQSCPLVSSRER